MNELIKNSFNYGLVDEAQEMKLRIISERISVRVQRTAEEMLAMGSDLIEAKAVCKEDGKLFSAWCESGECPVGYRIAQNLMSVQRELGLKNAVNFVFENSLDVLSTITQTRESDIKAALLEHIEAEAEQGEKVTQKEINLLKKTLKESKTTIEDMEDKEFNAQQELKNIVIERNDLKEKNQRFIKQMNKDYKDRQDLDKKIKDMQEEIDGLDEAFESDLVVREEELKEELNNKPLTHKQVEEKNTQLKEIELKRSNVQIEINNKKKELLEVQKEFKELKIRDKALTEFNKGALGYRENVLLLLGGCNEMKKVPMTKDIHSQIESLIQLTDKALEALKNVVAVENIQTDNIRTTNPGRQAMDGVIV